MCVYVCVYVRERRLSQASLSLAFNTSSSVHIHPSLSFSPLLIAHSPSITLAPIPSHSSPSYQPKKTTPLSNTKTPPLLTLNHIPFTLWQPHEQALSATTTLSRHTLTWALNCSTAFVSSGPTLMSPSVPCSSAASWTYATYFFPEYFCVPEFARRSALLTNDECIFLLGYLCVLYFIGDQEPTSLCFPF